MYLAKSISPGLRLPLCRGVADGDTL